LFTPNAGDYYIQISASTSGLYDVSVREIGAFQSDTYADRCSNPALLQVDGPGVGATIDSMGMDEDWFTFPTAAWHKYHIRLTRPLNSGDPVFDLYQSACGARLTASDTETTLVAWDDHGYDIRVHSRSFADEGYYEIVLADLGPQVDDYGNTPTEAMPIPMQGEWIQGAIDYMADVGTDVDWFSFETLSDHLYEITFYSQSAQNRFALQDLDGQEMGSIEVPGGSYVTVTFLASADTTALLQADQGSGLYEINIAQVGVVQTDLYSNRRFDPNIIDVNGPALGDGITHAGRDEDWFVFAAEPLHRYVIDLTRSLGSDVVFDLEDDDGRSLQLNATTLTLVAWEAQTYRLRVHSESFQRSGYYDIVVDDVGRQSDDYGNTHETAASIIANGQPVPGTIGYEATVGGDEDWFRFVVSVPGTCEIALSNDAESEPGIDLNLYRRGSDGNLIPVGTEALLSATSVETATEVDLSAAAYFISISGTGPYTFSVLSPDAQCGDPEHPYPPGDLNHDCVVDLRDLAVIAENWLADNRP